MSPWLGVIHEIRVCHGAVLATGRGNSLKKKQTYIKIYIILEFGKCGLGFQEAIAGSPNNSGHSQGLAGLNSESSFALVDVKLGITLHSGSINPP